MISSLLLILFCLLFSLKMNDQMIYYHILVESLEYCVKIGFLFNSKTKTLEFLLYKLSVSAQFHY